MRLKDGELRRYTLLSTLRRKTTLLRWDPRYLLATPNPASNPELSMGMLITMLLLVSCKGSQLNGANDGPPPRATIDTTEPVDRYTLHARHIFCRARDNTWSGPSREFCLRFSDRARWPRRRRVRAKALLTQMTKCCETSHHSPSTTRSEPDTYS